MDLGSKMVSALTVDVHVPQPATVGVADQADVASALATLSERLAANEAFLDREVTALTQKVEGVAAIVGSLVGFIAQALGLL